VEGYIGYSGLESWWLQELTDAERNRLEEVFQPMTVGFSLEDSGTPSDYRPLTQGRRVPSKAIDALIVLIGWVRGTNALDRTISRKIREKLTELVPSEPSPLPRHFGYQMLIYQFYRDRDVDPAALESAIAYCEAQAAMAPEAADAFKRDYPGAPLPSHYGFRQLAIIRDKQCRYNDAVQIVREAARQGWAGDWAMRAQRYRAKLSKVGRTHVKRSSI
jgi:hypothetical protein